MHTVLDRLRRDHRNFRRLLEALAAELAVSEHGEDPDLELIMDIVYYIERYSDSVHHTAEDVIYEVMRERHPDCHTPVAELLAEHDALRQLTIDVQTLVSSALNDVVIDRELLDQRLASFIDVQRAHMFREEKEVFSQLEQVMDESDWRLVAERAPDAEDPLFGSTLEDRYRSLYERITGGLSRPAG